MGYRFDAGDAGLHAGLALRSGGATVAGIAAESFLPSPHSTQQVRISVVKQIFRNCLSRENLFNKAVRSQRDVG